MLVPKGPQGSARQGALAVSARPMPSLHWTVVTMARRRDRRHSTSGTQAAKTAQHKRRTGLPNTAANVFSFTILSGLFASGTSCTQNQAEGGHGRAGVSKQSAGVLRGRAGVRALAPGVQGMHRDTDLRAYLRPVQNLFDDVVQNRAQLATHHTEQLACTHCKQ